MDAEKEKLFAPEKNDATVPRRWGWLLLLLSVILLLVLAAVLYQFRSRLPIKSETIRGVRLPNDITLRFNQVTFRGLSGGKVVWEVSAKRFDVTKDKITFVAKGIDKIALLKEGKNELLMSAGNLQRNMRNGDITVDGAILLTGNDITLRTEQMMWNDNLQQFSIPKKMVAQMGDIVIHADGGTLYQLNEGKLQVDGKIKLIIKGNSIVAEGISLDVKQKTIDIHGPIHAVVKVADVKEWSQGKNVPKIPALPPTIIERYNEYRRQHPLSF